MGYSKREDHVRVDFFKPSGRTVPLPEHPGDVPTVSLHVLAKNAESVLGRLLDCVGHLVQEVRVVLNDTTDASEKVVRGCSARWPTTSLDVQRVTSETHPQFYFLDAPESYEVGRPLAGERFAGPCTRAPLLCDWASARNLGWDSNCDWRLFLDADDVVDDPHKLPGLLAVLADLRADLAATKYAFGHGDSGVPNSVSYRERLARNVPSIRWAGKTHEILEGGLRRVLVEDCFSVTDLKDNWGRGVRVPGRCFKVLYRDARLAGWQVPPRHLAYLVQECPGMMPASWVVDSLLPAYAALHPRDEERAWVLCMVGEMLEARNEYATAASYYEEAVEVYPSAKAAFRLCRASFLREDWRGCLDAYELGKRFVSAPQVLDLGPVYEDSSKILVAEAHHQLGHAEEARALATEVARLFPRSAAVAALRDRILAGGVG
jgi:tetratricopeptide (TPR) repeat protein